MKHWFLSHCTQVHWLFFGFFGVFFWFAVKYFHHFLKICMKVQKWWLVLEQTSSSSSQQWISLYIGGKIEGLSGKPPLVQTILHPVIFWGNCCAGVSVRYMSLIFEVPDVSPSGSSVQDKITGDSNPLDRIRMYFRKASTGLFHCFWCGMGSALWSAAPGSCWENSGCAVSCGHPEIEPLPVRSAIMSAGKL